jgi:hypothetical protein
MTLKSLFIHFLLIFVVLRQLPAQENDHLSTTADSTRTFRIETTDGEVYIGKILRENEKVLVIRTGAKEELMLRKEIIRQTRPAGKYEGDIRLRWQSLYLSHFILGSNGYGPRKGEGYYQNCTALLNQAGIGLTNFFSLGVGFVPSFDHGYYSTAFGFMPRFNMPILKNKVHFGFGGVFSGLYDYQLKDWENIGLIYGNITFGPRHINVSIGTGYGYADGWADHLTLTISATYRLNKKIILMTENYIPIVSNSEEINFSFVTGRFLLKKIAIESGLLIGTGYVEFKALPIVGVLVPFRWKRLIKD